MPQPLSTEDFLLTNVVTGGVVDAEPVAIAIRTIVRLSPCGTDPAWTDIAVTPRWSGSGAIEARLEGGGSSMVQEMTIATPWSDLIPVARG